MQRTTHYIQHSQSGGFTYTWTGCIDRLVCRRLSMQQKLCGLRLKPFCWWSVCLNPYKSNPNWSTSSLGQADQFVVYTCMIANKWLRFNRIHARFYKLHMLWRLLVLCLCRMHAYFTLEISMAIHLKTAEYKKDYTKIGHKAYYPNDAARLFTEYSLQL